MRYAIVSDLHANRPAWESVLTDIAGRGADTIVCLGDVVGYGPMPQWVLDDVRRRCSAVVIGNHDAAACGRMDASIFHDEARAVVEWTRDRIDDDGLLYLLEVPSAVEDDDVLFVHAEVEFPERFHYVTDPQIAAENLAACHHRLVFVGHTHEQAVFVERSSAVHECSATDFQLVEGCRYLVNVGSVGEPRDPDDLRARYVIYDSDAGTVEFCAVNFDFAAYREDLEREGLPVVPYFLQALEAHDRATVVPRRREAEAMGRIPIQQARELSARGPTSPSRLVVVATRSDSAGKSGAGWVPVAPAVKRDDRRAGGPSFGAVFLVLLLLAAASVAAVKFWPQRGSNTVDLARRLQAEAEERLLAEGGEEVPGIESEAAAVERNGGETRPLSANLVSYWSFDRNSQVDSGSFQPMPEPFGKPGLAAGRSGRGLSLKPATVIHYGAAGDYSPDREGLTVCFWYRTPGRGDERRFAVGNLPVDRSTGAGWQVVVSTWAAALLVDDGSSRHTVRCVIDPSADGTPAWRHVVAVIDPAGQRLRLFLDGVEAGEDAFSDLSGEQQSSRPLAVGTGRGVPKRLRFQGMIDDLAIWRRALGVGDVARVREAMMADGQALGSLLGSRPQR